MSALITNEVKNEVVKTGLLKVMEKNPLLAIVLVASMSSGAGSFIPNLFGANERLAVIETRITALEQQQIKSETLLDKLNTTMVGLQTTLASLQATLDERGKNK